MERMNPTTNLLRCFEQTLLGLFLTLDTVASPGHGIEAFGVDFFSAGDAFSEAAFADASESAIDHVEKLPVVVALAEEEFLVVGAGGAVGDVLRGLVIGGATILLIADNHVAQFVAPGLEFLSKRL
jgi:hypothetical protein